MREKRNQRRYKYQCARRKKCGIHVTLRKPLAIFKRKPKCPACGLDTLQAVDE